MARSWGTPWFHAHDLECKVGKRVQGAWPRNQWVHVSSGKLPAGKRFAYHRAWSSAEW